MFFMALLHRAAFSPDDYKLEVDADDCERQSLIGNVIDSLKPVPPPPPGATAAALLLLRPFISAHGIVSTH